MAVATSRQVQLNTELLLGMLATSSWYTFLNAYARSLPRYIDDAERDFGIDIYERMMRDPALASSVNDLRIAALSQGPRFLCRVPTPSPVKSDPEGEARFQQAEEIRGFVEDTMDNLQQPLEDILEEMLDFLTFGHKVAEQVYELRGGRMVLARLKVKPRTAYNFVVDKFMNLEGLIAASPSSSSTLNSALSTAAVVNPGDILPREKFFILTYQAKGGDPRGGSILRPAYNPWYLKMQVWPMYLKFLSQFGTPSVWATLPENTGNVQLINTDGTPQADAEGNLLEMTAAEAMLQKLIAFANGTALVLEHDSALNIIEPKGNGEAFLSAIDLFDRQMTKAVLIAIRATMESQHGSRADSETAQGTVAEITQGIRRKVEIGFYRDVITPLIRYNFGDEAADGDLCPYMSLSEVARENITETGNMIANLARSEMIHTSQLPGIDSMLGLPERDFEAQRLELADDRQQAQDRAAEMDKLFNPARSGDDLGESEEA